MLLVASRLRVQLPWMKILVLLHELILEVDRTELAILTYLIEGASVEALVRIGDLIAAAIVFVREVIQFGIIAELRSNTVLLLGDRAEAARGDAIAATRSRPVL